MVRVFFMLLGLFISVITRGQSVSEEVKFLSRLKLTSTAPDGVVSSRSIALFTFSYSQKELEEIQKGFQQMGIDPVSYIESERALAGSELMLSYSRYFAKRDIRFLIFMQKDSMEYRLNFVPFNGNAAWTNSEAANWMVHSSMIRGLLEATYRGVVSTQKRQNFLVNDSPERQGPVNAMPGDRNESWAPNVKALKIAVPRFFADASAEKDFEAFLKENLHVRYEYVDPAATNAELQEKGFTYVLRFIHAPGSVAKDILGYDMSKSESALATVSYQNGLLQLKTIPSTQMIYKFYLRQLETDTYYLGPKWDADITWQDALKNHLDGYRAAGRIN